MNDIKYLETQANEILTNLSLIFKNCSLLIYKLCPQNDYKNPLWDSKVINYKYVPPTMYYCKILNQSQISYIIEYYTNATKEFSTFVISNGLDSQLIAVINTISQSVSMLNIFSKGIFTGFSNSLVKYRVPKDMTLSTALWLNNISLDKADITILYNLGEINSFLLLKKDTLITLVR